MMNNLSIYIIEKLKINRDSKNLEIKSKYGYDNNETIDKLLYLLNHVQDNVIPASLETDLYNWFKDNKYNKVELFINKENNKIKDILKEIQITNTFIDNDAFTAYFNKRAKNNAITKNNITYCTSNYDFLIKFKEFGICIKGFKK